jgi:hypothetical protein
MTLEAQMRRIFKKNGFVVAAEMMELHRLNNSVLRRMIASWDNYPACMNKYPTHLLVKRTYDGEI